MKAYSRIDLVTTLDVRIMIYFLTWSRRGPCARMDIILDALAAVFSICLMHISLVSRIKPSILKCVRISNLVLLICELSLVLFFTDSRVKSRSV